MISTKTADMHASPSPAPPVGTVYGVVLNDRGSIERMGATLRL